eukprot:8504501-Pyramimonas_sp.AAC.1
MVRKLLKGIFDRLETLSNSSGALLGPSWTASIHKLDGYSRRSRMSRARASFRAEGVWKQVVYQHIVSRASQARASRLRFRRLRGIPGPRGLECLNHKHMCSVHS